jgi:hypothetical protein
MAEKNGQEQIDEEIKVVDIKRLVDLGRLLKSHLDDDELLEMKKQIDARKKNR